MKYFFSVLLVIIILSGCQGMHCFKIFGEYKGISGETEYCFNKGESKSSGVPSFESKTAGGVGETIYAFTADQVSKIKDKLLDGVDKVKDAVGLEKQNKPKSQIHPVKEILEIIEKE